MRCLFVLVFSLALSVNASEVSNESMDQYNRELIIKTHLKKYESLSECMLEASEIFDVPEWLIYAITYHERGPMYGSLVNHKSDKTKDYGPTGINDKRIEDYAAMGVKLTGADIERDPCVGVRMTGHLVRKEYNRLSDADKNWLTAVGNYHYNKRGKYPHNHFKYIDHIKTALRKFQTTLKKNKRL